MSPLPDSPLLFLSFFFPGEEVEEAGTREKREVFLGERCRATKAFSSFARILSFLPFSLSFSLPPLSFAALSRVLKALSHLLSVGRKGSARRSAILTTIDLRFFFLSLFFYSPALPPARRSLGQRFSLSFSLPPPES